MSGNGAEADSGLADFRRQNLLFGRIATATLSVILAFLALALLILMLRGGQMSTLRLLR